MHSPNTHSPAPHTAMTLSFFASTSAQVALAFLLFWWIAPGAFAREAAQPGAIVLWTIGLGLPLSLFEYLYHRYLLHSAVLPFLGSMHRAHGQHHSLTTVKAPVSPKEPAKLVTVESEYPVEHEHQAESMMFPLYSASIFFALFLVLLGLPLKLLFPGAPVLFAVLIAVTLCYALYESWHAVMHLPDERFWTPMMNNKRIGRVVRYVYSFHLMHHWRPSCNLAVVGFWGIAIWDHLFRTHRRPKRLPLNGAEVSYTDVSLHQPLWPIRQLDRLGKSLFRASRKIETFIARLFFRRSPKRA